jgi:PAS domain S-box-containing protein
VKIQALGEVRMLVDSFNKMARDLQKTTVSKEYVDNIFKSMIDTLIVASPDGTIRTVNHAACELLGYREEELTGQPIKIIFAEDGERAFEELVKFPSMKNAEYTYITKNKRKIPVLISSSVIYSSDATPQGIVCVAVDITERKRAEEALNRSSEELQHINEELKNFAYIVSHDLRAPLVNIKGFSEELGHSIQEFTALLEKYPGHVGADEKQRTEELLKKDMPEALGFIGSSVTRMDALINSILKLSRLGRNELKRELVHTEELVHPLLKTLAHQIDMHKADVTIGPLPDIIMDKTAVEQIFGNLLDNALKYLDPSRPGKIAVTAEQNAGETTFTIRDNGRGIAKEDTQRVFELFRRVGRQDVPGEGMGLTYVKTLVRRLGGRIWCESEPGVGSVFSFTIPAHAQTKK